MSYLCHIQFYGLLKISGLVIVVELLLKSSEFAVLCSFFMNFTLTLKLKKTLQHLNDMKIVPV